MQAVTQAEPRIIKEFDASDISDKPFGWNLPNWLLRREMVAHLDGLETVDFRPGTGFKSLFTRESEARVELADGTRLRTKLGDRRGWPQFARARGCRY